MNNFINDDWRLKLLSWHRVSAGFNAVCKWRYFTWTDGALVVIFFPGRQRVSNVHCQITEFAFQTVIVVLCLSCWVGDSSWLLIRTAPIDWTTTMRLVVDRNATVLQSLRVMQVDVTVDLMTVFIFLKRLVFPVFAADTRVTAFTGIDSFPFIIGLIAHNAFRQLIQSYTCDSLHSSIKQR